MKATQDGIVLGKAELTALLTFTSDDERFAAVHFMVPANGTKLEASATDGHRAVEVFSTAEDADALVGEWLVSAEFLDSCKRTLQKGEICTLQVTKKGLKRAVISDIESGEQRSTISWPRDAASTQISMDTIRKVTRIKRRLEGSWFAVQAEYLKDIAIVSAACGGNPVTLYPPADAISALCFEASGYEARWSGVVMPVRVVGPGDEAAEETEDIRPKDQLEKALDAFDDLEKKHGVKVTLKASKRDSE